MGEDSAGTPPEASSVSDLAAGRHGGHDTTELDPSAMAALAAFRAIVEEVASLRGRDDAESMLDDARVRLGAAMKEAVAAGVTQDQLLEASARPQTDEASGEDEDNEQSQHEPLRVGDKVVILGLESEAGKLLNGNIGTISGFLEEKGRVQVDVGTENPVSLRPINLRRHREEPLKVGDRVKVFGLESEAGSRLNGRGGVLSEYLPDKERFKVDLGKGEVVSIRPANLRREEASTPKTSDGGKKRSRSLESSSTSSSEGRERQGRKHTGFSNKSSGFSSKPSKKKKLTPEEHLESLLKRGGKKERTLRTEEPNDTVSAAARQAGAAAAAAAAKAAAAVAEKAAAPLQAGDRVEVYGLQSAAGKQLNGKVGVITMWDDARGRFLVELGMPTTQSLKPDNLRSAPSSAFVGDSYCGSTAGYTLL